VSSAMQESEETVFTSSSSQRDEASASAKEDPGAVADRQGTVKSPGRHKGLLLAVVAIWLIW
jgi:hypothetical protein